MRPLRVLVQCTIAFDPDDWHVGRFSSLVATLRSFRRKSGEPLAEVVARNRSPDASGRDPVIAGLTRSEFDEAWIFGVDGGQALDAVECAAVDAFQRAGGGVLTARDHQNMGMWLRNLRGVGGAHFFHDETCREPDPERWSRDDRETLTIDYPNYHSGSNGDPQSISPVDPLHPLLLRPGGGRVEFFPAHPHEGAVRPPAGDTRARSVARGQSTVTSHVFDLVVAFDRSEEFRGRGIAESSFHHFADFNWNPASGAPSFVTEAPASGLQRRPEGLEHTRDYVRNLVTWLAPPDAAAAAG